MFDRLRRFFSSSTPADARAYFMGEALEVIGSSEGVSVVPVRDSFALDISIGGAKPTRMFLENLFAETREVSPEERRKRIAFYLMVLATSDTDEPWEEAKEMLVPVIRAKSYGLAALGKEPELRLLRRPFLPYLDHVVAIDMPSSLAFVNYKSLAKWSVNEADVFAAAQARIDLLANPKMALHDDTHGPLFVVASDDTYEACRLLVPGWLASFRDKVEGTPIAIIPDRATLMVGGDRRPELVARMQDTALAEFRASNRRMSPALYTVDAGGSVIPYERSTHDELASRVREAHALLAEYEESQLADT